MTNDQKKQLETQLWNIADSLRGKMNADEFRDYCLGFIFYKYLSERLYLYANEILSEDKLDFLAIDENSETGKEYLAAIKEECIAQLGYFLNPSELFSSLAKRALGNKGNGEEINDSEIEHSTFILDDLTQVLANIERSTMGEASEDDFDRLFEDLDLTSTKLGRTPRAKNTLIAKILVHLDKIDFRLEDSNSDVLGDAYEYLIGQFASGAGKKAGEFYTPQQVSEVLAKIVTTGKDRLKSVYDPTCGSGSLLLRVAKEVDEVAHYYGQEMNRTTYNLARMNMILHGVHYRNFDLKQEDTLESPQHPGKRFEAVVANPPFSAQWSASKLFESDDRFSQYGKLAPKSKADFAFVQHMLHHLDDNGTMAVVLPHGVLFRGAAEGDIRRYLIKDRNWLDAVIGLPANVFYGTSIPTCILVFKKRRQFAGDILFIDASAHFEKAKNQNYLRPQDIYKIVTTYRERLIEDKYSYRADLAEIAENDFNLNIPRYVDTFEEEKAIDLQVVSIALEKTQEILEIADTEINKFCRELEIPTPKGCNINLLQAYKKGVMQKIFSQQIRFKQDDGKPFPDWQKKKLGEVANFHKGKGISKDNLVDSGKLKCIRYAELYTSYNEVINHVLSSTNLDSHDLILSIENDVIIPSSGETSLEIAKAACVKISGVALGGDLNILRTKINGCFLAHYLNYYKKNEIARIAQGNTVVHLYNSHLKTINIEIPVNKEQEKIANFLTSIDKKIDAVSLQIEKIEEFKNGLLQKMFV
ncbi:type I site-specific deoxyribonuclease [Chondrocystis sp. NIES-4102]|nr:type I site-specific deoxyribonuclease [Chondrocystis sp. NIES-4102]